jgi:hypothetical protein
MNGVFGATLGPDGLEIANLSALTIKSETGVPLMAVDAKPKPDTYPLLSIFTVYCAESPLRVLAVAVAFCSTETPLPPKLFRRALITE